MALNTKKHSNNNNNNNNNNNINYDNDDDKNNGNYLCSEIFKSRFLLIFISTKILHWYVARCGHLSILTPPVELHEI